jgi:hypothetical protein
LPKFFWLENLTAILNPMFGNSNQILTALLPYALGTFFSLLVAIAWTVAFFKLRHVGAAVLAFAPLLGSILAATGGAVWFAVLQGQRQLLLQPRGSDPIGVLRESVTPISRPQS